MPQLDEPRGPDCNRNGLGKLGMGLWGWSLALLGEWAQAVRDSSFLWNPLAREAYLECSPGRISHKDPATEARVSGDSLDMVSFLFHSGQAWVESAECSDSLWLPSDGFAWSSSSLEKHAGEAGTS